MRVVQHSVRPSAQRLGLHPQITRLQTGSRHTASQQACAARSSRLITGCKQSTLQGSNSCTPTVMPAGHMMYFTFLWWMAALFCTLALLVGAPTMAINLAGK